MSSAYVALTEALVPFYGVMCVGYLGGRYGAVGGAELAALNTFVARFALPALVVRVLATADVASLDLGVAVADLVHKAACAVLVPLALRAFPAEGAGAAPSLADVSVWHTVLTLPNTIILGVPAIGALFDMETVELYLAVCFLLQASVHTVGIVCSLEVGVPGAKAAGGAPTLGEASRLAARRVLRNPVTLAAAAGVALSFSLGGELPTVLDDFLEMLQRCVSVVALFTIGVFTHLHGVVSCDWRAACVSTVARFAVAPAINLGVCLACGLRGDTLRIMAIQGALPQAVMAFSLYAEYGEAARPDIFSTNVGLGTLLSLPALAGWYWLVTAAFGEGGS